MSRSIRRVFASPTAIVGAIMVLAVLVVAVFAPLIAPHDPNAQDFRPLLSPSVHHLFGTDEFGRDVLSRVIYGSRQSVVVSFIGVGIGVVLGALLGLAAGLRRGVLEAFIMRTADVLLAYPGIILGVAVVALFGVGSSRVTSAIAVVTVPIFTRLAHAAVLREISLDYVPATVSLGATPSRLAFRHLLPNALPTLIPQISLSLGSGVLIEAALSFLGLGAQPPTASWGLMLSESRPYLAVAPLYAIFPGLALVAFVIGFNLVGDAVHEAMSPRSRVVAGGWITRLREQSRGAEKDDSSVALPDQSVIAKG